MAKAQITFSDINLTVTVPAGTRLIEISEKVGAGLVYGCREGDCGTCLMQVMKGMEHLSQPSVVESRVLRAHFAASDMRLACQAQALDGEIVVRPA